jgi:hypothetical protein
MWALFKAYIGKRACKAIGGGLQALSYLSRVGHNWKFRARTQRKDVGKCSFINRIITDWNQVPEGAIRSLTGNTYSFRMGVKKSEAK